MRDLLNLKILSKERVVKDAKVSYVFIPNLSGVVKISPNHVNYTSILSKGKVVYKEQESEDENSLEIEGGVCSLNNGALEVLVDL